MGRVSRQLTDSRRFAFVEVDAIPPADMSAIRVILTPLTASARSTSTIPSSIKADGTFENASARRRRAAVAALG